MWVKLNWRSWDEEREMEEEEREEKVLGMG